MMMEKENGLNLLDMVERLQAIRKRHIFSLMREGGNHEGKDKPTGPVRAIRRCRNRIKAAIKDVKAY